MPTLRSSFARLTFGPLLVLATQPAGAAESETATIESAPSLPLPYEAWSAPAPRPPTRDVATPLAPPLARTAEVARRPLEFVLTSSVTLPSCAPGSVGDRGCSTVGTGLSLSGNVLYRVTPFFATGAEFVVGGFRQRGQPSPLDVAFAGLAGRVYFADRGAWEPYVGLGFGLGRLRLRPSAGSESELVASSTGFATRVTGGIDFAFTQNLRLGVSAGFAHWLTSSEQRCESGVCSSASYEQGRLSGFANLGLAMTGSFGEAL